jgi:haloalkane dehalogenase
MFVHEADRIPARRLRLKLAILTEGGMEMRIEFTPSPQLFPFQSRWHESNGVRVHYVDEGSGPAILMCHGNPTWSFLYRNVIAGLRDRFRCIAVDYPGFGLSDRPDGYTYTPAEHASVVGRLVDQLGLEGFIVMGQDWGGPIGSSVATDRAERLAGSVFMNTWYWPADRFAMKAFSRVMSSSPMQRRILEKNFFVERLIPSGTSRKLSEEEMDHYRGVQPTPEARQGVAVFPRQILAASPWLGELAQRTPQTLGEKPMLLFWGMRDRAFGAKKVIERWQSDFPDGELHKLRDANHFIQEDAPEEIASAVTAKFG